MSSKVMVKQSKGVRVVGVLTIIAGIIMIIAGGVTWWTVSDQLSAEKITVSEDASFLAGEPVQGPFTAYAQAEVINKHALELSDGMTYAQLERDDPRREVVMNGSFLRASLFTSVVSFGVAALVIGLGVLFILIGWALNRLTRGTPIAAATAGGGGIPGAHSYDDVPSAPAPRHQSPPAASGLATGTTDRTATDRSAPGVNGVGTTSAAAGAVGAAGESAASRDSAPITNPGPPAANPVEPASAPTTAPAGTPVTAPGTVAGTPQETPGNPSPGTVPAGTPQETPGNPSPGTAPAGTPQETPGNPSPGTTPADERPAGWASPADRVPPVDGTTDENGTTR